MRCLGSGLLVVAMVLSACTGTGDVEGPDIAGVPSEQAAVASSADADPVLSFCSRWPAFAEFVDREVEPTEDLVAQVVEMQAGVAAVLPDGLESAWAAIVDWNQAFIELFEATGYRQPTEPDLVLAFGNEEAASAAAEAREAGFGEIWAWTEQRCADTSKVAIEFCRGWSDVSSLAEAGASQPGAESYDLIFTAVEATAAAVPDEVRVHWDAWVEFARGFAELMTIVGYDPDRITPEMVATVFGSAEAAEPAERAADEAAIVIDAWSLDNCGDFCTRWPELRRALDETGSELAWVNEGEEGRRRLNERVGLLEVGSELAPDEIRDDWDAVVTARLDWIDWWQSFDFTWEGFESQAAEERAIDLARDAAYLFDDVLMDASQTREGRSWQAGRGGTPDWLIDHWRASPSGRQVRVIERLERWVGVNCEATTGLPGTFRVVYPSVEGAAGGSMAMALLPRGSGVADLADPASTLAGACESIQSDPWGPVRHEDGTVDRWESEEFKFRFEEQRGGWCDFRHEGESPLLDAGAYTLVVAAIEGGRWNDSGVAPSTIACLELDVEIDGDTVVELPALAPCHPDSVSGPRPEDPWWRPPPVDPATPGTGTLRVVVPATAIPEDVSPGEIQVVVLPAGTTLNDVGREEVWPAGAAVTWLPDRAEFGHRKLTIPVAALPAGGSPRAFEPHWLFGRPAEDLVRPALLAPGAYDVHVSLDQWDEEAGEDVSLCAQFMVSIDGNTVAETPDLESCA